MNTTTTNTDHIATDKLEERIEHFCNVLVEKLTDGCENAIGDMPRCVSAMARVVVREFLTTCDATPRSMRDSVLELASDAATSFAYKRDRYASTLRVLWEDCDGPVLVVAVREAHRLRNRIDRELELI